MLLSLFKQDFNIQNRCHKHRDKFTSLHDGYHCHTYMSLTDHQKMTFKKNYGILWEPNAGQETKWKSYVLFQHPRISFYLGPLNHWQVVKISMLNPKNKNSTFPILTEISHFLNYHNGKCFHMEAVLTLTAPTEAWVKAEALNVGHSLARAVLLQICHGFAGNWQSQMSCHVTWDATLKLGTQVSHCLAGTFSEKLLARRQQGLLKAGSLSHAPLRCQGPVHEP